MLDSGSDAPESGSHSSRTRKREGRRYAAVWLDFKKRIDRPIAPSRREVQMDQFLRPLPRLSVEASLNEALKQLLGRRCHMALVEDKAGHIAGLLTLEDVLEEIAGELQDEFDDASSELIEVAPGRWKAGGAVLMEQLLPVLGGGASVNDPNQPLHAWLRDRLGRDPVSGDILRVDRVSLTVIQTRRHKAHRVLIEAPQ